MTRRCGPVGQLTRRIQPAEGEQRAGILFARRVRKSRAREADRLARVRSGRGRRMLVEIHHPGRTDLDQVAMPQRPATKAMSDSEQGTQ